MRAIASAHSIATATPSFAQGVRARISLRQLTFFLNLLALSALLHAFVLAGLVKVTPARHSIESITLQAQLVDPAPADPAPPLAGAPKKDLTAEPPAPALKKTAAREKKRAAKKIEPTPEPVSNEVSSSKLESASQPSEQRETALPAPAAEPAPEIAAAEIQAAPPCSAMNCSPAGEIAAPEIPAASPQRPEDVVNLPVIGERPPRDVPVIVATPAAPNSAEVTIQYPDAKPRRIEEDTAAPAPEDAIASTDPTPQAPDSAAIAVEPRPETASTGAEPAMAADPPREVPVITLPPSEAAANDAQLPLPAEKLASLAEPSSLALAPQKVLERLPKAAEIVYKLSFGLFSGKGQLRWQREGAAYSLSVIGEPTGILAMARSLKISFESRGSVVSDGLAPAFFVSTRPGKSEARKVRFDHANQTIVFGGGDKERSETLPAGVQDTLSFLMQFIVKPPEQGDLPAVVTFGRKIERFTYGVSGADAIQIEGKTLDLVRLTPKEKTRRGESVEVWLAVNSNHLPVRIHITDRNNNVLQLVATSIRLE